LEDGEEEEEEEEEDEEEVSKLNDSSVLIAACFIPDLTAVFIPLLVACSLHDISVRRGSSCLPIDAKLTGS
jgi:hypothetical protein